MVKIKADFVTNSSTTSFVFAGFEVDKDNEMVSEVEKQLREMEETGDYDSVMVNGVEVLTCMEDGALSDDRYLVGYTLGEIDDEGYTKKDGQNFSKVLEKILDLCCIFEYEFEDVKIYSRVRMS